MAGSFIEISVYGEKQANKVLQNIIRAGQNLEPALQMLGDYLIESTQDRRSSERAPDGTPWEPLSPLTIERKGHNRILENRGTLFDSLNYQITGNTLTFGSNQEYAAMQQFGGTTSPNSMFPNKPIPAREFIGISATDDDMMTAILQQYLKDELT